MFVQEDERIVQIQFNYLFDAEDLARIARACGISLEVRQLFDEEINQYVSDILTFELTSPDPLENAEVD